jgi:hypothetical protein
MTHVRSAFSAPCAIPMTRRPNTTGADFPDAMRQSISRECPSHVSCATKRAVQERLGVREALPAIEEAFAQGSVRIVASRRTLTIGPET